MSPTKDREELRIDDSRAESKTPIPPVHIVALDEQLRAFLEGEAKAKQGNFTIEKLFEKIDRFGERLDDHATRIDLHDTRLDDHDERLDDHQEKLQWLKHWTGQHDRVHANRGLSTALAKSSIPPMRNVEDTGSFMVNEGRIATAKAEMIREKNELLAQFEVAQERNRAAFEDYKEKQTAKELAEKQALIVELKEEKKTIVLEQKDTARFFGRTGIGWAGTSIGAIVLAIFVWWLAKH